MDILINKHTHKKLKTWFFLIKRIFRHHLSLEALDQGGNAGSFAMADFITTNTI
jgi:hypothetical protein